MAYASPPYHGYPEGTPSPSPLGRHGGFYQQAAPSPRHYSHSRHASHDYGHGHSSPGASYPSPRYSSSGRYSTRTGVASPFGEAEYVSDKTRKTHHHTHNKHGQSQTWSFPNPRFTQSYRASYGDSDEDELINIDGDIYIIPGGRRTKQAYYRRSRETNHYYPQGFTYDRDGTPVIIAEPTPRHTETTPRRSRRASASTPQRPSTANRPSSSSKKQPPPIPKATEADAREHHIPAGYSLKNWDPTEEPIMLLGSVFDANSLGKWIYDWTVYRHGPATPISDVAGELWLLLIQLAGKVKRSEECMPRIRSEDNRLMINDFIESGERLMDKLKKLLKSCEGPMLKVGKRLGSKEPPLLGKNSGVEFVDSIFGRDRQLDHTEKFMASIRLWNLRFDANCEDILLYPTA
ncbi:hypothetical protein VE00_07667 [Pseudogymnoascus sp. WSF 3629]|nr:hypothetical protein VE00_07667 [Pseudogymnoascus sp. WSF 3629]